MTDGAGSVSWVVENAIATITLRRKEKRNALTVSMLRSLSRILDEIAADAGVRVVVLEGEGRIFCAGADLAEFATHDPSAARRIWIPLGHRVTGQLANLPQPTIAHIHGDAFGGGLELILACDYRLSANTVRLGLPEVSIGTLPGWGGTGRLAATVGPVRAKEIVLLSQILTGPRAEVIGLVTQSVADELLANTVGDLAQSLAAQPTVGLQLAKQVMLRATSGSHDLETFEGLAGALSIHSQDLREGVDAFISKRAPQFKGV